MERDLCEIVRKGSIIYLILEKNNHLEIGLDSKGIDHILLNSLKPGDRIIMDVDERDRNFPKRIMALYVETKKDLFQPFFWELETSKITIDAEYSVRAQTFK